MRFNNKNKIPSKYILLALTILCLLLIGVSYAFEDILTPLRYITGVTITPMQRGVNVVGEWVGDKLDLLADIQTLQAENQELRRQLEEYQTGNRIQISDTNELDDLRELYELDSRYPNYEKVAANVFKHLALLQ